LRVVGIAKGKGEFLNPLSPLHNITELKYIIMKFSKSLLKSKNNNTRVHHVIRLMPRHIPPPGEGFFREFEYFTANDNDEMMLKAADLSFAVANAKEKTKKAADFVTLA